MTISKHDLLGHLPLHCGELTVRAWCRDDIDRRAAWRPYPPPYSNFSATLGGMAAAERDTYFWDRDEDSSRVTLTVDHPSQATVGHIVLRQIDWKNGTVGNMGVRIHPDWCDQGIGTGIVETIVSCLSASGIARFRLDVAGTNARAIRCYEKAGFVKTKDFDRNGVPFLWMEFTASGRPTNPSNRHGGPRG